MDFLPFMPLGFALIVMGSLHRKVINFSAGVWMMSIESITRIRITASSNVPFFWLLRP